MVHRSKPSARSRLTTALAEQILNNPSGDGFALESEYALAKRFHVSRVTVRLALSELESKGLIYRRQGKGTFAHGRTNRIQKSLGILLKTLPDARQRPVAEIIRGFFHRSAALQANVLLIHAPPEKWSPEMRKDLGGLLLFPTGIAQADLEIITHSKIPYLFSWETSLPGAYIDFEQQAAARTVAQGMLLGGHEYFALIGGFDQSLDALKRQGVHEALMSVGIPIERLLEFTMTVNGDNVEEIATEILAHRPQITAVITTDESIAFQLIQFLREKLSLCVPDSLSVASFNGSSLASPDGSNLSRVDFEFFEGGEKAAESLNESFLRGAAPKNIKIPGKVVAGCSVGSASSAKKRRNETACGIIPPRSKL